MIYSSCGIYKHDLLITLIEQYKTIISASVKTCISLLPEVEIFSLCHMNFVFSIRQKHMRQNMIVPDTRLPFIRIDKYFYCTPCRANQLTGFYITETLAFNELMLPFSMILQKLKIKILFIRTRLISILCIILSIYQPCVSFNLYGFLGRSFCLYHGGMIEKNIKTFLSF